MSLLTPSTAFIENYEVGIVYDVISSTADRATHQAPSQIVATFIDEKHAEAVVAALNVGYVRPRRLYPSTQAYLAGEPSTSFAQAHERAERAEYERLHAIYGSNA